MDLPREEIAFRKQYESLLLNQQITTVFHPGIRVHPHRCGYITGEVVTARVIEQCGADEAGGAPVFNDIRVPVQITRLVVLTIGGVEPYDFAGSSPDVCDRESLREHITHVYHMPIECFDGTVTRIQFRYLV